MVVEARAICSFLKFEVTSPTPSSAMTVLCEEADCIVGAILEAFVLAAIEALRAPSKEVTATWVTISRALSWPN